jgi:hypothetical protein
MPLALPPPQAGLPQDLLPLRAELIRHGFTVRLERPPNNAVYGVFNSKLRTIWIDPLTIPLGIFSTTFLHETVHAAQSCSPGRPSLLGTKALVLPVVNQEINYILSNRYDHSNRALEREAFLLQSQPDAIATLMRALRSRCNLKSP